MYEAYWGLQEKPFENTPDPQPESWAGIEPGTPEWSQGHIGHGAFLTRETNTSPDPGPDDPPYQPGITYTSNATMVHVFQAADGDTNGDRYLNGFDIAAILASQTFPYDLTQKPADWPSGDFVGPPLPSGEFGLADGKCDGFDIQAILASNLFPTPDGQPYAAAEPGTAGGEAVELMLYVKDVDGIAAGTLVIDAGDATLNGYVIDAASGLFTGDAASNLGWFQEDSDSRLSGNMGFTLTGQHSLGQVIGAGSLGASMALSFTYTVAGAAGVRTGALVLVPEPCTVLMLLAGAVAMALFCRRRLT